MEIPPEIQIKSTLKPGSVYYFVDESLKSSEPHYFIVLNYTPLEDHFLLLVCSSHQISKVKWRNINNPPSTLVEISPSEYDDFTKQSIIDCNSVFARSIQQLRKKLESGQLKLKSVMPTHLLEKLRKGALDSPKVAESLKRIIRQ